MNSTSVCRNACQIYQLVTKRLLATSASKLPDETIIDPPENLELAYLNYERRRNDPVDIKKARLLYQSRKRGMLENGLLLSTFAAKYLSQMNETQLDEYDKIINLPSNDWDIFYWALGTKPTPPEFENNVMKMLKEHVKNVDNESRSGQPSLYSE